MNAALILLEILVLMMLICGLHLFKGRLGLGPLYGLAGLFSAALFYNGIYEPQVRAEMFFDQPVSLTYALMLPGLLVIIFVVYVLEGSVDARRMAAAVGVVYVIHAGVDGLYAWHAAHPPPGVPYRADHAMLELDLRERIASLLAVAADFVVLIVVYQFMRNRIPRVGFFAAAYCAFVASMLIDSVVFSTVYKGFSALPDMNVRFVQKAQAGLASGIPTSLYVWWQLHRHRELLTNNIVERGTFDILKMHRQIKEAQARLSNLKDTFGRYVPPSVVERLARDPGALALGGEQRVVSVLFCDVRGYSTLVEKMPPTEVIELLNRYLEHVSQPILDVEGMINEIEGDGVLAVFGAPLPQADHASRAVRAASAIQRAVEHFNAASELDGTARAWQSVGIDRIRVRIGVHTGPSVVGNIGSERRVKYAVIGDTVNTAARVEALCKTLRAPLLVTAQTLAAMEPEARESLRIRDRGVHAVKGRVEPVHVYEIDLGLGPLPDPVIEPSRVNEVVEA